jgi:hypothetical protein
LDEYKWNVVFDAYPGARKYIYQNYIEFLLTKFGSFHAGCVTGVEDRMVNDANTHTVQGACGKDGAIWSLVNSVEGLPNDIGMNLSTGKCLKISYFTPRVLGGLQFGVSYAPNVNATGRADQNGYAYSKDDNTGNNAGLYPNKDNRPNGLHNVALALNYAKSIGAWYMELSGATILEKTRLAYQGQDNIYQMYTGKAYQLGAVLKYKQWELAGGYLNNLRSRLVKELKPGAVDQFGIFGAPPGGRSAAGQEGPHAAHGNSGTAWNVGLGWQQGSWQLAVAYNRMDRRTDATNKSQGNLYTATVDWAATRGLVLFCELDYLHNKTSDTYKNIRQAYYTADGKGKRAIGKNSAFAAIIGTKVRF